jgi:hypothetical protein
MGHLRRFWRVRATSASPPTATGKRTCFFGSFVPKAAVGHGPEADRVASGVATPGLTAAGRAASKSTASKSAPSSATALGSAAAIAAAAPANTNANPNADADIRQSVGHDHALLAFTLDAGVAVCTGNLIRID